MSNLDFLKELRTKYQEAKGNNPTPTSSEKEEKI